MCETSAREEANEDRAAGRKTAGYRPGRAYFGYEPHHRGQASSTGHSPWFENREWALGCSGDRGDAIRDGSSRGKESPQNSRASCPAAQSPPASAPCLTRSFSGLATVALVGE